MPCFVRQALETARQVSADPAVHEQIIREVLDWVSRIDLEQSPPHMAQQIHRRLREITGNNDPYRPAKEHQNRMALSLVPELRAKIEASPDPLVVAVRLAIAGNVIDMGVNGKISTEQLQASIHRAMTDPFVGDHQGVRQAMTAARRILFLADNAGEIVLDRLLVEALGPDRVTVAVRGAPIINDATLFDAQAAGLVDITAVMDNGSDAPGTLLDDCSDAFKQRFFDSDLIIAKGQGNFETLSDAPYPIIFLFQAKCPVIAEHAQVPLGSHVWTWFQPATFSQKA